LVADELPPPNHVPLRRLVPNFITTAALCCGLAALHFASKQNYERALVSILAAAILDALDGRAARLLRVASPFGATLDSLADFISFGVAPAFILYKWKLDALEPYGFIAAVLFALCAAMRLARFTALAKSGKGGGGPYGPRYFLGMPTPGAAGAALVPVLLSESKRFDNLEIPFWLVMGSTLLIAGLMVSRIPIYSFKGMRISRTLVVPLLVLVGAVVIAATRDTWLTVAGLGLAFLLSVPVSLVTARRVARRQAGAGTELPEQGH